MGSLTGSLDELFPNLGSLAAFEGLLTAITGSVEDIFGS